MPNSSHNNNKFTISEATRLLHTSADTLRRLEAKGKIHPVRDGRGGRIYSYEDVELLKLLIKQPKVVEQNRYYSLEETAKILKISKSTLRRWDRQGLVKSVRTAGGH